MLAMQCAVNKAPAMLPVSSSLMKAKPFERVSVQSMRQRTWSGSMLLLVVLVDGTGSAVKVVIEVAIVARIAAARGRNWITRIFSCLGTW